MFGYANQPPDMEWKLPSPSLVNLWDILTLQTNCPFSPFVRGDQRPLYTWQCGHAGMGRTSIPDFRSFSNFIVLFWSTLD